MTDRFEEAVSQVTKPLSGERPPRPLAALQVLRAIAALAVVVNHAFIEAEDLNYIKTPIEVDFGSFGVDIFFVVSGFTMIYSNVGAFGSRSSVSRCLSRRIIRIVPLYWIVATLFLITLKPVGKDPGLCFSWSFELFGTSFGTGSTSRRHSMSGCCWVPRW